ncbi:MAG: hypothetical protein KatS3mg076_0963 [Candidatus Binatia bacterium]|nr:MAG: hypothetical protein KatS3mg076_0963 [Candidatus Binatia bacterium]
MEKKEEELIRSLLDVDPELRERYEEHLELERRLEEFHRKRHLTTEEEMEKKTLQKKKLAGKDRMMEILARYRGRGAAAERTDKE